MNENNFYKFEQCKYRTVTPIQKKGCCSNKSYQGYACKLKNIFPLSPITHCQKCKEYKMP